MSLKISLPTLISCLTGTVSIGVHHLFGIKIYFKNQKKYKESAIDKEKELPVFAESVWFDKSGHLICRDWRSLESKGQIIFPDDCQEISKKFTNDEDLIGKTIQKIKVKKEYLEKVLFWNNVLKENYEFKNKENENWKEGEWNCQSKKNSSEEDPLDIFVSCISKRSQN